MNKEPKKTVAVSMPTELHAQLKELARENCYSLPGYIRHILLVHLREKE